MSTKDCLMQPVLSPITQPLEFLTARTKDRQAKPVQKDAQAAAKKVQGAIKGRNGIFEIVAMHFETRRISKYP